MFDNIPFDLPTKTPFQKVFFALIMSLVIIVAGLALYTYLVDPQGYHDVYRWYCEIQAKTSGIARSCTTFVK